MPDLQFTFEGNNATEFIERWAKRLGWSEAEVMPDGSPMAASYYVPMFLTNEERQKQRNDIIQEHLATMDADAKAVADAYDAGVIITIG